MKKNVLISLSLGFMSVLMVAPAAMAARPVGGGGTATPLGIDVSWPQCGKQLPKTQAFGIVGVNGGLATTTNPCFAEQLVWAKQSIGGTPKELVQLYVNTANPGGLNTISWPKNNTDSANNVTANPYGICDGTDSLPCAWQYGWNRAVEDVRDRFQPAAIQAGVSTLPSKYIWWLDVETENTWKMSGSTFDNQSNVAVLEGMTGYFKSGGGRVGLYSTGLQWREIVGSSVSSTSNLNGLNNWRPGGANLTTAKDACNAVPLTPNGIIVLTQFVSKNLDYNYSCI